MKKTKFTKILSLLLCLVLVAAIALIGSGCGVKEKTEPSDEKEFNFVVTHSNGEEKSFTIKSSKKTVGEALGDEKLISGEDGMVFTVDGETVKFEDEGKYWAFYIDGKYAMTGVEKTDIENGKTYAFKVEQ